MEPAVRPITLPSASPPGWPIVGNLPEILWNLLRTRGNFIRAIQLMLGRHGAKTLNFRIGRRKLQISVDPAVAHRVLVEEAGDFPKTGWEERVLRPVMEGGLILLKGEEWKNHRQALGACFGSAQMTELAEMVLAAVRARLARWGPEVNVSHEMRCIVNDVMFRFFLDEDDLEHAEGVDPIACRFAAVERGLEDRVFNPIGPGILFKRAAAFVTRAIRRGLATPLPPPEARAGGECPRAKLRAKLPSEESVLQEVRTTMGAGATTGNLMSWACQLLAEHPEIQERVRSEISARTATPDPSSYATWIESLPWLSAVIHETLRLYPPAPFLIRQTPSSHPDMIFVSLWAMQRDPDFWPEPDRFDPARWLEMKSVPTAFAPFGMGPRVCIGKRFALLEARIVLSEILRRFCLRPLAPGRTPSPKFTVLTRAEKDIRLKLTPLSEAGNPAKAG